MTSTLRAGQQRGPARGAPGERVPGHGTAGAKACGGCDRSEDNPELLWQETGAEARPRGASGPSEDTGAPEAQWGGLERPQEGREGTAPGEQRSAVAEGLRPGPRRLAASWPPLWPDAVTAASVGAALWEERLRQRPPNMKRLETARTGTDTRCPRGGGGGARARVEEGGHGRRETQGSASATTAASPRGLQRPRRGRRAAAGPRARSGGSRGRSC